MRELPRSDKQRVNAGMYASLSAAVADLPSGGGIVWCPNGTRAHVAAQSIAPGVEIEGESRNGVTINVAAADAAFKVATPNGSNNNAIALRNLTVVNTGSTPYGLDLRGMTETEVENVELRSFATAGIILGGDTPTYGNAHTNALRRVEVRSSPTCVLSQGTVGGGASGTPMAVNVVVDECRLYPTNVAGAIAIDLEDAQDWTISRCDIAGAALATGLMSRANSRGNVLLANRFEDVGGAGGPYPVHLVSGTTFNFLVGNRYATTSALKVYDEAPSSSKTLILDIQHRTADFFNAYSLDIVIPILFRVGARFQTGASSTDVIESKLTADAFKNWGMSVNGKLSYYDPADGTTVQASLEQASTTVLKATAKLTATAGLGAGNSAAATTLGSVTKKMEVFDAGGASLGFVPIYDAIT